MEESEILVSTAGLELGSELLTQKLVFCIEQ